MMRKTILLSGSPFYGYIAAADDARVYPDDPAAFARGLAWAAMLGDSRAAARLSRVHGSMGSLTWGLLAMQAEWRARRHSRGMPLTLPVNEPYPANDEAFETRTSLSASNTRPALLLPGR